MRRSELTPTGRHLVERAEAAGYRVDETALEYVRLTRDQDVITISPQLTARDLKRAQEKLSKEAQGRP